MSISLQSDMPMAPARPLQLVWSAVNRVTAEGKVSGPDQRLDLETALRGVTIDAAFSIRLEDEVGSIVPGKLANFTVLEANPFDVEPTSIKDIKVWGTVLEGRVQQAPESPKKRADVSPKDASRALKAERPNGHARTRHFDWRLAYSVLMSELNPGHLPEGLLSKLSAEETARRAP